MRIIDLLSEEKAAVAPKPPNFVAKHAKKSGAGQHKDKKKAEKQGDTKHKKDLATMEGVRDLGYDAQSLIMKLRRDIEEKRLQPTREAVLSAARELAGDMDFAPELLVQQVLGKSVAEAVEDRTSYQVAKVLHDHGIKYDPAREDELVKVIELALVKKLAIDPRQVRGIMNDEDFLGDTFGELRHMEEGVAERVRDPEDWDEGNTEPGNNFAIYINGKKWKVLPGPAGAYADSPEERRELGRLQAMAQRKSQETGKKWEVSITGEPATR